ncbi:agglutinin-like protein 2 [Entophlyctis luteolus]|nr:agglutinin-like protein 2 [Entophlyctis luteolus]
MALARLVTQFLRRRVEATAPRRSAELQQAPLTAPVAATHATCLTALGANADGKLGVGDSQPRDTPASVTFFAGTRLRALAAGAHHTCVVAVDPGTFPAPRGALFGWGSNFYGQAGHSASDEKMGSVSIMSPDDSEDLDAIELPSRLKLLAPDAAAAAVDMRRVVCADFHSLALDAAGSLWSWGAGCLGRADELYDSNAILVDFFTKRARRVLEIAAAGSLSVVIAQKNVGEGSAAQDCVENEVYVWGYFEDASGNVRKSTAPLLVTSALQYSHVSCPAASQSLFGFVCGSDMSSPARVVLHGKVPNSNEMPMYPLYIEMANMNTVFDLDPISVVDFENTKVNEVKDLILFRDIGFLLLRSGSVLAFLQENGNITKVQFNFKKPIDQLSIGAFGASVVYRESGETVIWRFHEMQGSGLRGREILHRLTSDDGTLIFEKSGKLAAVGWDHAMFYQEKQLE